MEVRGGAQAAVPPCRVARPASHRRAGLPFLNEPAVHRRAHQIDSDGNERIEVVVERIAKRRSEDHCAGWSSLVVIVDDLRIPRAIENAVHSLSLGLRRHVRIAIVVVSRVLLIQPRHT